MNQEQLTILGAGEEASEVSLAASEVSAAAAKVAQMCSKNMRFGMFEVFPGQPLTNAKRLHLELDDLAGMVRILNEDFGFGYMPNEANIHAKIAKFKKFAAYSQELGCVTK